MSYYLYKIKCKVCVCSQIYKEHMKYFLNIQTLTPSKSQGFPLYIFLSKKTCQQRENIWQPETWSDSHVPPPRTEGQSHFTTCNMLLVLKQPCFYSVFPTITAKLISSTHTPLLAHTSTEGGLGLL